MVLILYIFIRGKRFFFRCYDSISFFARFIVAPDSIILRGIWISFLGRLACRLRAFYQVRAV